MAAPLPDRTLQAAEPRAGADGTWLEAWQRRVLGMALALTRERHAAEDLAQDVFARALTAEQRPVGDGLGPWLYRVAKNLWIDRLRAAGRRERAWDDVRGARGGVTQRAAPAGPADHDVPAEEPPVLALWRLLPEDERLVVWLRLMVDVPFREIALLLDTSKSAVDRTFRRALDTLRKELER